MHRYNVELWQCARDKLRDRGNFPSCPVSGKNISSPSWAVLRIQFRRVVTYSLVLARIKQSFLARVRVPARIAHAPSRKWNTGIPESRPCATRCVVSSPSFSSPPPSSSSLSSKSSGLKLWPPASSPARYTSRLEVSSPVSALVIYALVHPRLRPIYVGHGPIGFFPSARPSPLSPIFLVQTEFIPSYRSAGEFVACAIRFVLFECWRWPMIKFARRTRTYGKRNKIYERDKWI